MGISHQVATAGARTAAGAGTGWRAAALLGAGTLLGGGILVAGSAGLVGAAPTAGALAPVRAAPQTKPAPTVYYLALGDSLAAGVGSPDGKGYVADVYAKEKKKHKGLVLENLSCSGATTTSMIDGGGCSYTTGSQLGDAEAFLSAHSGAMAYVTIDIGANDVDGCTNGTSINETCITNGMNTITTNLPVILSGLSAAAGGTPVAGMSYYDPFLAAWLLGTSGQSLAQQSVTLLDNLNNLLAKDYGASETADVAGAFDSADFAPGGHYAGTAVPVNVGRICAWTLMCSEENIHANDIGHAHIAKAFEKILTP